MPRQLVLPSLVSGVIWGIAQVAWFQANISLGFAIAFPIIASLPGFIGLLIGFCFLGEVRTRQSRILALLGLILRVPGVLLIALSGLWGLGINMPQLLEPNMGWICLNTVVSQVPQVHKWCDPVLDGHLDSIWISLLLHAILWSIALRGCFGGIAPPVFFLFSTYHSWREFNRTHDNMYDM